MELPEYCWDVLLLPHFTCNGETGNRRNGETEMGEIGEPWNSSGNHFYCLINDGKNSPFLYYERKKLGI